MVHGSKNSDDWADFMSRRFTPSEIQDLIDVPTALQRKWVQLHLRNAPLSSDWWDVNSGRRQFTWSGLQFFQFFRDVTQDLGTRFGIGIVSQSNELQELETASMPAIIQSNVFGVDHRTREQGDLFLFRSLSETAPLGFHSASVCGLGRVLAHAEMERLYTYNISAMQRRLAKRLLDFKNFEIDLILTSTAVARK